MIKIIGSIEILGNPMGLIRQVGEGFYDLIDMPREVHNIEKRNIIFRAL
jgi:hypothetical protein